MSVRKGEYKARYKYHLRHAEALQDRGAEVAVRAFSQQERHHTQSNDNGDEQQYGAGFISCGGIQGIVRKKYRHRNNPSRSEQRNCPGAELGW